MTTGTQSTNGQAETKPRRGMRSDRRMRFHETYEVTYLGKSSEGAPLVQSQDGKIYKLEEL